MTGAKVRPQNGRRRIAAFAALAFGLALGLAAAGCSREGFEGAAKALFGRPASSDPHLALNQLAPEFRVALLEGGELDRDSLHGRWTVVQFWGLWCPSCRGDLALTAQLQDRLGKEAGMDFVSIHVDRVGGAPIALDRLRALRLPYPVGLDTDGSVFQAFNNIYVPTYLIIDPEGRIRGARTQLMSDRHPQGGVAALLEEAVALKSAAAPI